MRLPPFFEHREHRLAHEVSVALRVIFIFGRDGVRAEEGGRDVDWGFIVNGEQGFEKTKFGGGLQTVARFGFDGGSAVAKHAEQTWTGLRDEQLNGRRARRTDRGEDAAALSQNLKIRLACHLHLEFIRTVAAPNDVRVRVDKARHDDTAVGIERRLVGIRGFEFSSSADRDNFFVAEDDRAVFDDTKRAEGMSALRSACEGEELGGGVDEHSR